MSVSCNLSRSFSICARSFKDSVSSHMWLQRQKRDPYVKRAAKETFRARSAFKLIEINDQHDFLKPGDVVVDIGAAPGSWSQVAIKKTNADGADKAKPVGLVIAVDRDYIEPLKSAQLLPYSDITDPKTIKKLLEILNKRSVSSVISDMAPNATGQKTFDHDAIVDLQYKALEFAYQVLKNNGVFLCKIWYGDRYQEFLDKLNKNFQKVRIIKPPASRSDSAECYFLAQKFYKSSQPSV